MTDLPARERLAKAIEALDCLCAPADVALALNALAPLRRAMEHVECEACGAWVPRDDRSLCHWLHEEPFCDSCWDGMT